MADGNKRYLGDVFINEKNYEAQKKFFKDIIKSYQFDGGDYDFFNATQLGGKTAADFADKSIEKDVENSMKSPIIIGETKITKDDIHGQYLSTNDIKVTDLLKEQYFDWYGALTNDNLSDALGQIHDKTSNIELNINDKLDDKLNESEFTKFKNDTLNDINLIRDTFVQDIDGNKYVNSQFTNGIRFILITQDEYDNLDDEKKNDWRNFYIIKDEIPADYQSPINYSLTDGYEFKVDKDKDGDSYLYVHNIMSDKWQQMCSLEELMSGSQLTNMIVEYLSNQNNEFIINEQSLLNSLSEISPNTVEDSQENYPFLGSNFSNKFVNNIRINESTEYITSSEINGLKNVNLDINSAIVPSLEPIINDLTTEQNKMQSVQNNIANISSNISSITANDSKQDAQLSSIENQLKKIENDIQSVENKIDSFKSSLGWKGVVIPDCVDGSAKSYCYYNETLRLAAVVLRCHYYWNGETDWDYRWRKPKETYLDNIYAKPAVSNVIFPSKHRNVLCMINTAGNLYLAINGGAKNTKRSLRASVVYKWNGEINYGGNGGSI